MNKPIAVVLLMLLLAPALISAQVSPGAQVSATLINQDPDPAEPGDTVELRFRLENAGGQSLPDVVFELIPAYPFTVLDGTARSIGTLASRQVDSEGAIVRYRVQIAPDAALDDYTFDARYRSGASNWVIIEDFTLSVDQQDGDLVVNQVGVSPDPSTPGAPFNISVDLLNQYAQRVRNVKVKVDLSDDVPFAPFASTSEITVPDVQPGQEKIINFRMITNPDAAAGLYKVPIVVIYTDQSGMKFNKSVITGIRVGSTPDLLALIDKSELIEGAASGTVTVKIVNKGLTDLGFMTLHAQPDENVDVLSSKDVYIGKLESDDFETADFTISVKKATQGQVILPLTVTFRDAANQEYTEQLRPTVRVLSGDEAKQLGKGGGNNFFLIVGVLVVAGIAIWWWRGQGRKKK